MVDKLWLKLFFAVVAAMVLCVTGANSVSAQEDDLKIYLDGAEIEFDVVPIIEDGRTLVPFRKLAENLGVQVDWNGQEQRIKATSQDKSLIMHVGAVTADVDGIEETMDVPPQIQSGRTLVPLRFFSETFDICVKYDDSVINMKSVSAEMAETDYQQLIDEMNLSASLSGFYAHGSRDRSSWTELFGAPYPNEGEDAVAELYSRAHLGWYEITSDGELVSDGRDYGFIRPSGYESVLANMEKYEIKSYMTVFAREKDNGFDDILLSGDYQYLVSELVQEVKGHDYYGINLDIEELGLNKSEEEIAELRQAYVEFVKLLSEDLAEENGLIITVPPPNSAYRGYDYEELSDYVDKMVVMAYDYHDRNEPSPTAPLNRVKNGIDELTEQVDSEQIVLGIRTPGVRYRQVENETQFDQDSEFDDAADVPIEEQELLEENGGSELESDRSTDHEAEWQIMHPYLDSICRFQEELALDKQWDEYAQIPYLNFQDDQGRENYIYMESQRSLVKKFQLADEYDLAGISFWRIGAVPDFVYELVEETFQ